MIDIISIETGLDLGLYNTQTERAANILSTQLRSLEYAQALGIDLKYFLDSEFKFQTESFQAYCIEILANFGINVSEVLTEKANLFEVFDFQLSPEEQSTGLVAR